MRVLFRVVLGLALLLGAAQTVLCQPLPGTPAPSIVLDTLRHEDRLHVHPGEALEVSGQVNGLPENATLQINGDPVPLKPDGRFTVRRVVGEKRSGLRKGHNTLSLVLWQGRKKAATHTARLTIETRCPQPPSGPDALAVKTYEGAKGRSIKMNVRTAAMVKTAQGFYRGPGRLDLAAVTQGSFSTNVVASAGTHDGAGVLDFSVRTGVEPYPYVTDAEALRMVRALRSAGFAAWYRVPPAFTKHIHAVAIGDPGLSPNSVKQLTGTQGYFRGKDGLKRAQPDDQGGPILCDWMKKAGYQDLRP